MEILLMALANLIFALATVLNVFLNAVMVLVGVRAVISWFSPDPYNYLYRILITLTEPILKLFRRYIPLAVGMFDFSVVAVLLVSLFLKVFLVVTLFGVAAQIRP